MRDLLAQSRLDESALDICISQSWIVPGGSADEIFFTEADVARAALIADLMLDLNVNAEGVDVILSLVERMHALRETVSDLTRFAKNKLTLVDL